MILNSTHYWIFGFILLCVLFGVIYVIKNSKKSNLRQLTEFTDAEREHHYNLKQAALEHVLGPMHDNVNHSLIYWGDSHIIRGQVRFTAVTDTAIDSKNLTTLCYLQPH